MGTWLILADAVNVMLAISAGGFYINLFPYGAKLYIYIYFFWLVSWLAFSFLSLRFPWRYGVS